MTLIMCDCDCIYQDDGYCKLDGPSIITDTAEKDCVNYICNKQVNCKNKTKEKTINC